MKYFVTGATGFIGGRLVRQLREAGRHVVALVRDLARAAELRGLGIECVPGDITVRDSLSAMKGCDGVFHIAGWYKVGVRDRSGGQTVNVNGTRNVLEAMRKYEIPRGVYTSTLSIYSDTRGRLVDESHYFTGPHLTEYDRSKWAAHHEVARPIIRQGLPLTIVIPGLVYGPGDTSRVHTTLVKYLNRKLPYLPRGAEQCWGFVDDIANAHILAMERGTTGEEYIIAGPRHSMFQAFQIAERITGIPAPQWLLPPWLIKSMATLLTPINAVVPLPEDYHPESLRAVAGTTYLGDNAKACRKLGYAPRPLEVGWRETLEYEMKQLGMALPT